MSHAMTLITGFSNAPLRIAGITGFIFTAFGVGVYFMCSSVTSLRRQLPGFPSWLPSFRFSGVQLLPWAFLANTWAGCLAGLNKPVYTIREVLKVDRSPKARRTQP